MASLCINITDGEHNTVIDTPGGEYFLLSCKNIKDGRIYISKEREIDFQTYEKIHKRTKTEKGDILMSSVGTIGECVYLNMTPRNFEFQRSVAIIKPGNIESGILMYLALRRQKRELEILSHGAVQRCLFISDISSFEVEVPNRTKELEAFLRRASLTLNAISSNNLQSDELIELRDSLLPLLMNGQASVKLLNNHFVERNRMLSSAFSKLRMYERRINPKNRGGDGWFPLRRTNAAVARCG